MSEDYSMIRKKNKLFFGPTTANDELIIYNLWCSLITLITITKISKLVGLKQLIFILAKPFSQIIKTIFHHSKSSYDPVIFEDITII